MRSYLGQNFLMNKSKLRKIADALDLKKGDTIIEIGPGHGELTNEIIARLQDCKIKKLILIEKDTELIKNLEFRIKDLGLNKNIEIIEGDALKEIKNQISKIKNTDKKSKIVENLKITGNIPYYITGYLLRILGELELKPNLIILTIQKEVAQRICAQPPLMNLLAASVQFWAEPKIIGYISKKDFRPAPKVDSAIIKFNIKTSDVLRTSDVQKLKYYKFIKILFKQPRKTIINNLASIGKKEDIVEILSKAGVRQNDRPQNLNIEQIKNLLKLSY